MIRIQKINPTSRMLVDYTKNGEMAFDNPIQRGYVWKREKKSLLIHSMIFGYPVPPIYANRVNGVYDVIDGQQRCKTIIQFLSGKFSLSIVPNVILPNGEEVELSGKKYDQLPREVQELIGNFNLDLHYGENLSQEEIKEMFIRLNNGKPLSATELTKAQIKSVDKVVSLTGHPLFKILMNDAAQEASKDVSLIMQSYIVLFSEDKCLLNSKIKQTLINNEITEEQLNSIKNSMDIMLSVFERLIKDKSEISKRVVITLKRKSHFASAFFISQYVYQKNINVDVFVEWLKLFFNAPVGKRSISEEYNENLSDAINSGAAVSARINAMYDNFVKFIDSKEVS